MTTNLYIHTPTSYVVFETLCDNIKQMFYIAPVVHPPRWQSMDVSKFEHMATHELLHFSFAYDLKTIEDLNYFRSAIKPNLPWADDHFLRERISGEPINPGTTYKYWPPGMGANGQHANAHLREGQQFDHSYAERYWPKHAGLTDGGKLDGTQGETRFGIRFEYGDCENLVNVLAKERLTRQAFLPVWFPEDIKAADEGRRVPCTLGYHFIVRNNRLDVVYYIRSCDFVRHFRDDVYLTVRLLLWVLQQVRLATEDEEWDHVKPGRLVMHITSFHLFKADHRVLFKRGLAQPGVAGGDQRVGTSGGQEDAGDSTTARAE